MHPFVSRIRSDLQVGVDLTHRANEQEGVWKRVASSTLGRGNSELPDWRTGTPLISHVPFVLGEDGESAELHLVRSNPIARRRSWTPPPGAPARASSPS